MSLWSHAKVSDPLYTGVPKIFFRILLFEFVVSNPFHVLEVGKKLNQNFPIYHPSLLTGVRLTSCRFTDSRMEIWSTCT